MENTNENLNPGAPQGDGQGTVNPENTVSPETSGLGDGSEGEGKPLVSQAEVDAIDAASAPGTGIDTNGDGNADLVTQPDGEPPVEVHVDHEDDYAKKVKLGMGNVIAKKTANKLVKDSNINKHYKDKMLAQIKEGEFQPPFDETFKRIKTAHDNGTAYRPGSEGL